MLEFLSDFLSKRLQETQIRRELLLSTNNNRSSHLKNTIEKKHNRRSNLSKMEAIIEDQSFPNLVGEESFRSRLLLTNILPFCTSLLCV